MIKFLTSFALAVSLSIFPLGASFASSGEASGKPAPDKVMDWLTQGNKRFVQGKSIHPHMDSERIALADTEDQGKHALATVLSCSDSRVPPEVLFDAGIMDLFVVRVAGNVANTDEAGSVEYGLCHVNTPVLVVLGHTQCGAVTAVTKELTGHGHALERNIPPLVASIIPAVQHTMTEHPELKDDALVRSAIEANVWEGIRNLFLKSPAVRELVKTWKVKVVGAVYDMHSGSVNWLPSEKVLAILKEVEASPERALNVMSENSTPAGASHGENKSAPASEEQSLAPKVRELAAKLESKNVEEATELKEFKGKIDSLGAQVKDLADREKSSGTNTASETIKTMSTEMKSMQSGLSAKLNSFESSTDRMFWLMISFLVLSLVCFGWIFWKLASLGTHHELLRGKVRKAFDRLNNDVKRLGG